MLYTQFYGNIKMCRETSVVTKCSGLTWNVATSSLVQKHQECYQYNINQANKGKSMALLNRIWHFLDAFFHNNSRIAQNIRVMKNWAYDRLFMIFLEVIHDVMTKRLSWMQKLPSFYATKVMKNIKLCMYTNYHISYNTYIGLLVPGVNPISTRVADYLCMSVCTYA